LELRKLNCLDCNLETKDSLARNVLKKWWLFNYRSKNLIPYCRDHLLEHFEAEFLLFSHGLVVFHPFMEEKSSVYLFETYKVVEKEWKCETDWFRQALDGISGKCAECAGSAEVAYFVSEVFSFDNLSSPNYKSPINLCKKCVLRKILPQLKSYTGSFKEGLWCPNDAEGMYFPSEI
jgi:hypothetical protein